MWKEYQRVAMHFNDLLMQLRSQSLAAVAAFAAIAGVFAKADVDAGLRWDMLASVLALLLCFWVAIWLLDFLYYNRLLIGAVDALMALEKSTAGGTPTQVLDLSTRIEAVVAERKQPVSGRLGRESARWWFYSVVGFGLGGGFLVSASAAGWLKFGANSTVSAATGLADPRWFSVAGLSLDLIGAVLLLSSAIVSRNTALELGVMRLGSEIPEENIALSAVKERLLHSRLAKYGLVFLVVGFFLQAVGSWPR